jgi:hypothetical protein
MRVRLRKSSIGYADGFHRSKVGPATKGLAARRPPSLTLGRYFEAELERPVCLQVVAGPRFEPAKLLAVDAPGVGRLEMVQDSLSLSLLKDPPDSKFLVAFG